MRLEDLAAQVATLRKRVQEIEGEPDATVRGEELSAVYEELRVAEEELQSNHASLADARLRAEEMLRRYQELFDQAPCAYLVTDTFGTVIEANHAASELLGVRADRLGGKPLPVFAVHDGRPELYAAVARLREGRSMESRILRLQPRDGGPIEVLAHANPSLDAQGRVVGARWAFVDLREHGVRGGPVEERRQFDAGLAWLADHVPALMSYVDAEERYQFVNHAYEVAWNRPAETLVGHAVRDVLGEAGYAAAKPHMDAALAGESVHYEDLFPLAIGNRWMSVTYLPDRDASGTVHGFYVLVNDVTERHLAEERARLQASIVAASGDGIVSTDLRGIITSWNPGAEVLYGYREDEVLGRSVALLAADGHRDELSRLVDAAVRGTRATGLQVVLRHQDGGALSVALDLTPLVDGVDVVGASLVARPSPGAPADRARQAVRPEGVRSFGEQVFDTLREPLVILDGDLRVARVNEAFRERMHVRSEEAIGVSFFDIHHRQWDIPALRILLEQVIPRNAEFRGFKVEHRFPDLGTRHLLVNAKRVDRAGGAHRILVAIEDVTDRLAAEAALREREARMRAIVDTAADGIVTADEHGTIESFNPAAARIFGYTPAEVIGENVSMLMPEPHRSEHDNYIARYVRTGQASVIGVGREVEGQRADGTTFPVDLAVSEHVIDGQRRFTGILRDLTERRRVEERLREAERQLVQAQKMQAIGRLASGISHDFKNVLAGVIGGVDIALRRAGPESALEPVLQRIRHAADRGVDMVGQLLAFSRRRSTRVEAMDLNEALENLEGLLRQVVGERSDVAFDLAPEGTQLEANASYIDQIVLNLVVNASEAMPRGGTITVCTAVEKWTEDLPPDQAPGTYVVLTVQDTGVGMSEQTRSQLFEPFFTTKETGTGLGLATVYALVHELGGWIAVDSALGEGTMITLRFPHAAAPAVGAEVPAGHGETVLVVEPDEMVRQAVRYHLEQLGYQALMAADVQGALAVSEAGPVDVVLAGVGAANGGEEIGNLQAQLPDAAWVCMTGDPPVAITAMEWPPSRAQALPTPFTEVELALSLRAALET